VWWLLYQFHLDLAHYLLLPLWGNMLFFTTWPRRAAGPPTNTSFRSVGFNSLPLVARHRKNFTIFRMSNTASLWNPFCPHESFFMQTILLSKHAMSRWTLNTIVPRILSVFCVILSGLPLNAQTETRPDAGPDAPWQLHPAEQGDRDWQPERDCSEACDRPCGPIIGYGTCCDLLHVRDQLWFRGEYLMWWGKSSNLPALATTSSSADQGILGKSSTQVLIGGSTGTDIWSGARFTLGWWTDPCHDVDFEVTGTFLGSKNTNLSASSDGTTLLARPFYNAYSYAQDSLILADSDLGRSGSMNVQITNEFSSLEALFRRVMFRQSNRQIDFIVGYRYAKFLDSVEVHSSMTSTTLGSTVDVSDVFRGENEFHSGEFGFSAKAKYERWSFEFLSKVALGGTQSKLKVHGSETITTGSDVTNYNYGMLALSTNSGTTKKTAFSVVPEIGMTVGCDLTRRLKASAGYSLIYWSNVVRGADQIDTNLNETYFPGSDTTSGYPAPQSKFVTSDYWVQGLNFSLEYQF
jgi:hypothetical protein